MNPVPVLRNAQAVAIADVPHLPLPTFRSRLPDASGGGARLAALFGVPGGPTGVRLIAVLAHDSSGGLDLFSTDVGDTYPAFTPACPQAHWFEREVAEQWGVQPEGHPWLKPLRFGGTRRPKSGVGDDAPRVGLADFFQIFGEEVHEVAVGPVHAGIIEPGHFRFQCHGERVLHLEISLGYQHRGIERALLGGPGVRALHLVETAAGDTTVGHALAYAQAVEALSGREAPPRAEVLRGVALELERLANHTGDLGALANDVGFLPTASFCGRLRGDFLNLTALLCGNRFGRGFVRPGGVGFDVDAAQIATFRQRLDAIYVDVQAAAKLLWNTASVAGRFEATGVVPGPLAQQVGLVGPAARASGIERDVRRDHGVGVYARVHVPVARWDTGDVFARALVRYYEIKNSVAFLHEQLENLPAGAIHDGGAALPSLRPLGAVVSLTEGWRGEICHVALTDVQGRFAAYKIVDPSFHNWFGLALALRGGQISDFPLCNKSFNLSYCGHDL